MKKNIIYVLSYMFIIVMLTLVFNYDDISDTNRIIGFITASTNRILGFITTSFVYLIIIMNDKK